MEKPQPLEIHILALPETAGSALYGMVDVLSAAGTLWPQLTGGGPGEELVRPRIVSTRRTAFTCGHGIPVQPELTLKECPEPGIVIVPELWLAPDDDVSGRHGDVKQWLQSAYDQGGTIYSACSGSILLAASGLLAGRKATSHWGYIDLFRDRFDDVEFEPEPNLVFGDPSGRIVTAGGTTSWHDLAIHIISRHCSPGEALRIAKLYLLKWHGEGQLPYASLLRKQPHADSVVRETEQWLETHFTGDNPVAGAVEHAGIAERSLKRRFRTATGCSLIEYAQNLRVERAKEMLEQGETPIEEISALVGYENSAFFRRLFKRLTGLNPGDYRRMFQPVAAGQPAE